MARADLGQELGVGPGAGIEVAHPRRLVGDRRVAARVGDAQRVVDGQRRSCVRFGGRASAAQRVCSALLAVGVTALAAGLLALVAGGRLA
ncbi:MAG: hypothetical protein AB7G09_18130, partial [Pseudonocardia sp.]